MPTVTPRKQIKAPATMSELRDDLCQMYADVSNDRAMVPQADAASNVAGKIINIVKLELEAAKIMERKPDDSSAKWLLGRPGK